MTVETPSADDLGKLIDENETRPLDEILADTMGEAFDKAQKADDDAAAAEEEAAKKAKKDDDKAKAGADDAAAAGRLHQRHGGARHLHRG